MKIVLIIIAALASLVCLHLFALWMERKGWIYYWHKQGSSSSRGNAFLEIQSIFEASKKHVVEIKKESKKERQAPGDPPEIS